MILRAFIGELTKVGLKTEMGCAGCDSQPCRPTEKDCMKSELTKQLETRALRIEYPKANAAFAHMSLASFIIPIPTFKEYRARSMRLRRMEQR